jgi:hypothetical protein
MTGNSYQRISGIYITHFNFSRTYSVQNGAECLNYCTSDTNISCVSLMTDTISSTCFLSEQTLGVYPDSSFVSNFAYTIVQLDCEPMTSPIEMIPCYGNVCSATNSECRDSVCKCVQGLRYKASLDQCTESKYNQIVLHVAYILTSITKVIKRHYARPFWTNISIQLYSSSNENASFLKNSVCEQKSISNPFIVNTKDDHYINIKWNKKKTGSFF